MIYFVLLIILCSSISTLFPYTTLFRSLAVHLRERRILILPFSLLALFSVFHGYAHVTAAPNYFAQPAFTTGFVTSMLVIGLLGMAIATRFWRQPMLVLGASASCAVAGLAWTF